MTSIRRDTTRVVVLTVGLLMAVGGASLWLAVRAAVMAGFDDGLRARAAAIQGLTGYVHGQVEIESVTDAAQQGDPEILPDWFMAWMSAEGGWRPLGRSPAVGNRAWIDDPRSLPVGEVLDVRLPDGRPGRALQIEFAARIDLDELGPGEMPDQEHAPRVRVLVAQARETLDRSLLSIGWRVGMVGLAVIGATILGCGWAVRRGLTPLQRLRDAVAEVRPRGPLERIPEEGLPEELSLLAAQLNLAFERIDEAFLREQRFTSDAAHELRTPLAEIRLMLEVALGKPREVGRWERTAKDAVAVLTRTEGLLASLLCIARGRPASHDLRTDLCDVVRAEVRRKRLTGGAAELNLKCDAPERAVVRCAPAEASSVLANLLENALIHGAHSPEDPVCVRVVDDVSRVRLEVENSAPQLTPSDVPRMFDPFWRKDGSRTAGSGFGLGLSVCKALVERAGGEISCQLSESGRLTVTTIWVGESAPASAL